MAEDETNNHANVDACSESASFQGHWPPAWLPVVAVLVALVTWPFIGYGAKQAWAKSKNRVEDWLPASFPETKALYAFFDQFGSDEFLMISWDGCVLADSRAADLATLLVQPADDGKVYFAKADSGRSIVDSLKKSQRMTETQAIKRLAGLFVGPDQKQTCVIALVSQAGIDDRHAAVGWAWQASQQATNLTVEEIHLAGTTADSVALDEASNAYLIQLNLVSLGVCFLILMVSLRNLWLVGTIFIAALLNQQLALAIIYFSGGHVDSVQLLVANLAFVLTISAGLHFLGYFRDALRERVHSPAIVAVRKAFLPTALAAATTSLGFISLCTSELVPIRSFGLYAAIVVPLNALLVVVILAIHVTWTHSRTWRWQPQSIYKHQEAEAKSREQSEFHWTKTLVEMLNARPLAVLTIWLVIVISVGTGVTQLKTSVGTHKMLSPDTKLIRDYAWLENKIGALVPIELVMHFPKVTEGDSLSLFERLVSLEKLRRGFQRIPEIQSTLSVLNFMPGLPTDGSVRSTAIKSVMTANANRSKDQFRELRLMYEDESEQSWRLSGRVAGSGASDYEQILRDVNGVIADFHKEPRYSSIQIDVSGGVPFIYRTQRQLMLDLLSSFSSAFAMIAITMALVFRSVRAGLLSMLPNVTPAAIVFGMMGWLGLDVELGTVLTASVMMGVCVDDTLHLISHFRSLRADGMSPAAAVEAALANCGGAMLQTAIVCGVGMLVFAFSPFTPVSRFAWLTFSLLMIGVISDLVLTPAILLSPLHRAFYREKRPQAMNDEPKASSTAEASS